MLRSALFAVAVLALVVPAQAADPDLSGNWMLSSSVRPGFEQNTAIIKVEMKDGKHVATVLSTPFKTSTLKVTGFEVGNGKTVKLTTTGLSFEGTITDGKVIGNYGNEQTMYRARLTKTDKTELTTTDASTRLDLPAPLAESQKLATAVTTLRFQAGREKDAEKKKELTEKLDAAQKEADEKAPALLRETIAKHADTPFAIDAAIDLLRGAAKYKVTADEVTKLLAGIEKNAAPFGNRYVVFASLQAIEWLATAKGLEPTAAFAAEKLHKSLAPDTPAALESRVLAAYKTALERSDVPNKAAALKDIATALAKIEEKIDAEYMVKVPPFKPKAYVGRNDTSANQVVVMELFTGAQCPPCVAADVAFDALQKSYKPTDLVLIQYHMHIPGSDPMTNPATTARWEYYQNLFPYDREKRTGIGGVPSSLFNGKIAASGGGPMANSEVKFRQYAGVIDTLLEKSTEVKVAGKATRTGDKIDIGVEVRGGDKADTKLRLVLVEETVKYVGGNQIRFHHQVVRAMPGGPEGVAIKDATFKHTATADVAGIRKGLTKYLDNYAADNPERPFAKPDRPMDMKALRVIALVQNDKTGEILQTVQIDVEGKPIGGQ